MGVSCAAARPGWCSPAISGVAAAPKSARRENGDACVNMGSVLYYLSPSRRKWETKSNNSCDSMKIAPNLQLIVPKDLLAGQILGLFVNEDQ
jgi:hypothetical protein